MEKKIVYKLYFDFPMRVGVIDEKAKVFDGRRLTSIWWADYKPEHDPLIQKHNKDVDNIKLLLRSLRETEDLIKPKL